VLSAGGIVTAVTRRNPMSKISDGVGGRGDDPASLEVTLANIAEAAAAFTERHGGSPTHVQLGAEFNALRAQVQDEIIEDGLMLIPKALGGRQIVVSRPVGSAPSRTQEPETKQPVENVVVGDTVYFESSRIAEGWWFEDGEMCLIFTDNSEYRYYGVPLEVWHGLCNAPSAGRYFNENILDAYEYKLVEDE
jgi:hypothetical protein